jgi:DNA adenine methylase
MENSNAYPFLKWVGGKTQIIDKILSQFPVKIKNYYEPFVGGGSVLIELLNKLENNYITLTKNIYVSDINKSLIITYNSIKENPDLLLLKLEEYHTNYNKNKTISKDNNTRVITPFNTLEENINKGRNYLYYFYRNRFNLLNNDINYIDDNLTTDNKVEIAALFIFLNKTCFRGLFRESINGFNVPFGNYQNPSIYDKDNLLTLNKLFNKYNVNFSIKSFDNVHYKKKSFVYLDPPYYPENGNSFVSYNVDGFNTQSNIKLLDLFKELDNKKCKLMMSNSDTEWINTNYNIYQINKINCKRAINSKKPDSTTIEVIIKNY